MSNDEPGHGPDRGSGDTPDSGADSAEQSEGPSATYRETEAERRLSFTYAGRTATVAQNREGYAMLKVRRTPAGDELERYYGFDMALDHAAELLGVAPGALPVPDAASDMGM